MVASILRELGMFGFVAVSLVLIARFSIRQYFEKQLKSYQGEIDKKQMKFTDLHEKRAEVIDEFYVKLAEFDQDMRLLVDPALSRGELSREEKMEKVRESFEEFRRYYLRNKIYFSPDACETVEEILIEYRDMFHDFSIAKLHDPNNSLADPDERMNKWEENWESLTEDDIPELKVQLEDQFRDLLGVPVEER